ncbi:MAG: M1 family peptidase, partial [Phaeodactylibacter sp.]|nr:M1 family peptidase [Phaeodactylibacter sp.]
GEDFSAFFEQYLWHPRIPRLVYSLAPVGDDLEVSYKWTDVVSGFDMPVRNGKKGEYVEVQPNIDEFQSIILKDVSPKDFQVATELYLVSTLKKRQ